MVGPEPRERTGDHSARRRPAAVAGASTGIGAEIARTLAAAGHPAALGARRVEKCEQVASAIRDAGGEAVAFELDIADSASVAAFAKAAAERLGEIEVVVANAGTMLPGTVVDTDPETFASVLNVNAVGVHRLIRGGIDTSITHP